MRRKCQSTGLSWFVGVRVHGRILRDWAWQIHFVKARAHHARRTTCLRCAPLAPENCLMPTSLIDSAVFRDIFTTEAMRNVFSDENRVQKYLDFEAALARAQARLGIIPKEAAAEIVRHCSADKIDMAKLKEATERIGYPVLPVVQQLVKLCKDGLGEWSHWGATTQDITDTSTVIQIREALALVGKEMDGICNGLA